MIKCDFCPYKGSDGMGICPAEDGDPCPYVIPGRYAEDEYMPGE